MKSKLATLALLLLCVLALAAAAHCQDENFTRVKKGGETELENNFPFDQLRADFLVLRPHVFDNGAINGGAPDNACFLESTNFVFMCTPSGGPTTNTVQAALCPFAYHVGQINIDGSVICTADGSLFPTRTSIAATGHTMTAPREYFLCSTATTCNVTLPIPATGNEFCIRMDDNVSANIVLSNITNVYFENPARTGFGSVSHGLKTTTGTVTNQICVLGRDTTHYVVMSLTGDWGAN